MAECLKSRPAVPHHLLFIWSAYAALRTDRQIGIEHGPIMFSSIDRYADRYGIASVDDFDRFLKLIRAMDATERGFKPGGTNG